MNSMLISEQNTAVILVDKNDRELGQIDKLSAHRDNLCHRAFSVCLTRIQDGETQLLLQQRQMSKYHGKGLWSNTCCSHPKPGEKLQEAAKKRLQFEMGITCDLVHIGALYYQANMAEGLFEHEYDHIFHGTYNGNINAFNTDEVMAAQWLPLSNLQQALGETPKEYTPWLSLVVNKLCQHIQF